MEELSNHNQKAFFRFDNQMYTQEKDNLVSQSKWGIHKNVTFISLFVCREQKKLKHDVELEDCRFQQRENLQQF